MPETRSSIAAISSTAPDAISSPDAVRRRRFRKIPRSIYERATLLARMPLQKARHDRKRVEMRFAHLKRILRLGRLRLRGPRGAQDEFTLAAIAQNLRRMAKLITHPPPTALQAAPA
jgi:hypothetical protein